MSIIKEYIEWEKTYNPLPPKPNKTYNRFFWWRRYQDHKPLSKMAPIMDKAKNGDYEMSPFWKQIQYEHWFENQEIKKLQKEYKGSPDDIGWIERDISKLYWARRKRLLIDAEKDEKNRFELLLKDMKKNYGGNDDVIKEMFNNFIGTIPEFIQAYKKLRNLPKIQPTPKS